MDLLTYLLTVTVVVLVPGPDMLFCLASGLNGGSRSVLAAALGVATGEVVHLGASAFGLAALFAAAPLLFDGARALGAAYLLFLGVRAFMHPGVAAGPHEAADERVYWRAFATNLLNPKMAMFSIAFLPQFVDSAGNVALQFAVLGAFFVALDLLVDGAVGVTAGRLRRLLDGKRARRNLDRAAGSVYVALAATTTRTLT
jgi:threonine/homoserine/homoserine lactone efflux protein